MSAHVGLHVEGTRVRAALRGELDIDTVPRIEAEMLRRAAGADELVVDLRAVTFMDSTGAQLLFRLAGESDERRRTLVVVAPRNGQPRRVLELMSFGASATLADSL